MDNPNERPPLRESLFSDPSLYQSLTQLYASKSFNRGVLLKNADFQRQNKKTYVRKNKIQPSSTPSSPAPCSTTSNPLRSPSSEEVTSPTLPRVRSLSDEECMVRLAGTLANRNTTNTTVQSESTTSFNNININITNSSTSSVTDVKLSTTTLTQPQSSLHAIAAAASIVATSTTTTAVAATATTTTVMTPASPNVNNKRRKLESSNNSNLNVNVKVDVSFEENVSGCKKTIDYDCFVLCDRCSGTSKVTDGNSNSGSGKGVGEGIACTQCNGMVWKTKKRLEVDIPPNGVKNGFKKTYKGLGSKGEDGTCGDLVVEFVVGSHPFYRRNSDDDTICECHISVYQAVLGTKLKIPKLYGLEGEKVEVCIEPGIQPNTVIRMPNQGMTKTNCKKKRGDLFIHVLIDIPTHLTQLQKELFERLATIDSMLDLSASLPTSSSSSVSSSSSSSASPPSPSDFPLVYKSFSTSSIPYALSFTKMEQ